MRDDESITAESQYTRRALELVQSHFRLLNDGNLAAARAQLFSPPGVTEKPLDVYVETMHRLGPFELRRCHVKRYEAPRKKRHGTVATVCVNVEVHFQLGSKTTDIIVWCFDEPKQCLISARPSHWVLENLRSERSPGEQTPD